MSNTILYCFPYAGGSSYYYKKWKKLFNKNIELKLIELAGRGSRLDEKFYEEFNNLIDDIYIKIKDEVKENKFAFFGHSMGGLISFELAHKIYEELDVLPECLFISGRQAPHCPDGEQDIIHLMSEDEFIDYIIEKGGTPYEIKEHPELLDIVIPILKADYKIIENYEYKEKSNKLNTDVVLFFGNDEEFTLSEKLGWKKYINGNFRIEHFSGDHFFINEHYNKIVNIVNQCLDE